MATLTLPPAEVTEAFVLAKCDYFVDTQLWPIHSALDPRAWLDNFKPDERIFAIHLLNIFVYLNEPLVDQLFIGAFQSLSKRLHAPGATYLQTQAAWQNFFNATILVPVAGETPHSADSGHLFSRKARQRLGVPEDRIMSPADAIEAVLKTARPIVFIDDFVGSGEQFLATWNRPFGTSSGSLSFRRIAEVGMRDVTFHYCPAVCTERGLRRLQSACPQVELAPAHVLPASYSVTATDSIMWPAPLLPDARPILKEASSRAGIPASEWEGFHELGLALAFSHSVPDATVPLVHWRENGWRPLVARV